ncbi:adenine phosphoribosyltransferase [Geobacter sp. SVR]|uniref:adenine phosphoribosyltransferase n=1 Tax=Geobacter sp. SVR TaxID=2495594 RepID=UPI00143F0169|nr:adenine phosphoribosyltransferase [Geobacter sp. SVR]BCS52627.1 adenine phosphoribosyltransferase [Geobacter sp. SVR]GCF83936.1 adenine phosphoribosyltransferase [Geobacter sp. SVR]
MEDLKSIIRDVPDFPKKGIIFKDITTLLQDARSYQRMVDLLAHRYVGQHIEKVVGVEARGFVIGSALAYKLGAGIVMVRKPGKLPSETFKKTYDLEYGTDTLEIHCDAIKPGERVLIADDLLATGGTMSAVVDMVQSMGGEIVECCFMAELDFLNGRNRLPAGKVFSLLNF